MTNPKGSDRHNPASRAKPSSSRVPTPGDILAAAQAAVEAAQTAAQAAVEVAQTAAGQALDSAQVTASAAFDTAVRLPPASIQLAAQLPDLIRSLTTAVERLNATIDRLDRTLALAEPAFVAYDRLLTRLESVTALGEEVVSRLDKLPGVSLLGRITGSRETAEAEPPQGKSGGSHRK
ncbi:hypothetical protein [Nocardia aurantiaca]|uniref:Uncharacterized protein n=1 Tax=Nocardia aurantiaca TaxID=2675850 RepID=A0A6I3L8K4_9NOCA|nr:hypothetical protein [Nocardia aurantiaca]MTE16189.1 hypothetical protein [Nocardia aurantiaca]